MNELPDPMPAAEFDLRDLRNAFGMFPTGVAIVTTCDVEGRPFGLTCNSFSSVSLKPPLVLWSLSLYSPSLPVFLQAAHFAINILACHQADLSRRFATRMHDRFAGVGWHCSEVGVPLIRDAAAQIECRNETRHYSGDHVVLIGQVIKYLYRDVEPLVFARGIYRCLGGYLSEDGGG